MALYAAHKGYVYQDLVTACFFAEALIQRFENITVDRKIVKGDTLDDLTIRDGSRWFRLQIKHSDTKKLELNDLKSGSIALKNLLTGHVEFHGKDIAKYSLILRWDAPDEKDILHILQASDSNPSLSGIPVSAYRLDPSSLWPEDGEPAWEQLFLDDFSRQDFVRFCNCLTIETEWPRASLDLTQPGVLEQWLIDALRERVGIGKYPNEDSDPIHVSSTLIRLATLCRAEGRTISPSEIIHQVGLRTDFGRIPQKFPVIAEKLVRRSQFAEQLEKSVLDKQIVVVTGPPGSGKSWSLSELAEKLRSQGYAVGAHYCYLEPGDPDVQKRITTHTLFGNLIAELLEAEANLQTAKHSIFAADAQELERMLDRATADTEIILLVDGLDHISRVFQETRGLALDEIDIVEQLALLVLPPHTHLVIGSQPGVHLQPLMGKEGSIEVTVPEWELDDMVALANRFGLMLNAEEQGLLHVRSEGNPLYATFLVKEMQMRLVSGEAIIPIDFLKSAPKIEGDISRYYEHLAGILNSGSATQIMEILALVDFALTGNDLKAIHPSFSHHVPDALKTLAAVLVNVAGQGGVRVYHESFRRFIAETLRSRGVPLGNVLTPVIDWLKNRGFYEDANAFRFLPALLRRAGLQEEVLGLMNYTFASDSVAAGYSEDAIGANIALAAEVASDCLDWPALARLAELKRAIHTCFAEKLNDVVLYGKTFAAVHGPSALCERLLFEGRPTFSSKDGLLLCSIADDLGGVPPWRQYLSQYAKDSKNPSEQNGNQEDASVDVSVAKLHGHIRLSGIDELLSKIQQWLRAEQEPPEYGYLSKFFQRISQSTDSELMLMFIEDEKLDTTIRRVAREVYVSGLVSIGERERASTFLTQVSDRFSECEAASYVRLGVSFSDTQFDVPDPGEYDVLSEKSHHVLDNEVSVVPLWVQAISLNVLAETNRLISERTRVAGVGWYRQWLLYVIDLAEAEYAQFQDQEQAQHLALKALKELEPTDSPFAGKPRTCDLYGSYRVIRETITRALNLLFNEHAWESALKSLEKISLDTTTYLDGSPTGPIEPSALAYILLPYVDQPGVLPLLAIQFEQQTEKARRQGEYYEVQAEIEMAFAQVLAASGDKPSAICHWNTACRYLTSYGFRKDVTLLEIIEPISTIAESDPNMAKKFLELTQSLVSGAGAHTDGRETRHFHNIWFSKLCKTDLALGLRLLVKSLRLDGGQIDWRFESAVDEALSNFEPDELCYLRLLVESTLPFESASDRTMRCLACVNNVVVEKGNAQGMRLYRCLAAHALGDPHEVSHTTVDLLRESADAYSIPLEISEYLKFENENQNPEEGRPVRNNFNYDHSLHIPIFPVSPTPFQILSELKRSKFTISEEPDLHVNTIGYNILELMENGSKEQGMRLIYAYADQLHWGDYTGTPLSALAEGLLRFEQKQAAATAYMLAYTRSRGNGGWSNLGGIEHLDRLESAIALSEDTTLSGVAHAVAKIIESSGYNMGITQHLIEMLVHLGHIDLASSVWQAAFEVISYRLPSDEECEGPFWELKGLLPSPSRESGLIGLLFSRLTHPEYRRKNAALAGVQQLYEISPDLFFTGLYDLLCSDISCCDTISVLQILLNEPNLSGSIPSPIENMLQIIAGIDHKGISACAQMILKRAGKTYPTVVHDTTRLKLSSSLSNDQRKGILSLDSEDRIDKLCKVWPEFPDLVARRFEYLFTSAEANKNKSKWRYEASVSRGRENWPVPLRDWFTELFELALNEVASGISKILWQNGEWSEAEEHDIAQSLLPNQTFHLRVLESRCLRPVIEKPELAEPSIEKLPHVTGQDEYEGWFRFGYYETQMVTGRVSFDIEKEVNIFAGAIVGSVAQLGDGMPAGNALYSEMWPEGEDGTMLSFGRFSGPLVGVDIVNDCNGKRFILGLLPWLRNSLGLKCNRFPDPLRLLDDDGVVHVAYRYWWSGALWKHFDSEIPRLEGCELLISPETYERIKQLLGEEPVLVKTLR